MPRNCPPVSHLLYADDTLIFINGQRSSLESCRDFLEEYCLSSGQKINEEKSVFIMHKNTPTIRASIVTSVFGYPQARTPFTYLGAPIREGRIRVSDFDGLI